MKLSTLYFAAASLSIFPMVAQALVGAEWSIPNAPDNGFTNVTFPMTIVEADHISGYYFAQQYAFVGSSDVGYTGLQPRPNDGDGQSVLHAVFSSFMSGTTTSDSNCTPGADGGPGVSCSVEWNGDYGIQYLLEIVNTEDTTWVGAVIDSETGARVHIGSYTLPSGTGGIQGSQLGFVEWYPWNSGEPANHCAKLPYQQTIFGNPFATDAGGDLVVGGQQVLGPTDLNVNGRTQGLAYEYGDCVGQVAFATSYVASGMENNCGFEGQTGS